MLRLRLQVIWLNRGVVNDFDTNGHVDNLVAYTAPGEVILPWTDDPSDPMYAVCRDSEEKLTAEPDAKGRTIKVHKVRLAVRGG
jgi:agmatine deiminase